MTAALAWAIVAGFMIGVGTLGTLIILLGAWAAEKVAAWLGWR